MTELLVSPDVSRQIMSAVQGAEWWIPVPKSDFRHPEGPDSTFNGRLDHPAIHIGWTDALKYCYAHGGTLPTEAQWEYAARGGLHQKKWPVSCFVSFFFFPFLFVTDTHFAHNLLRSGATPCTRTGRRTALARSR